MRKTISKKWHDNKRVLEEFEVPKWFLADVNVPFNNLLKELGVKNNVTIHKEKEMRDLFDEVVSLYDREQAGAIYTYFKYLKEAVWAKLDIFVDTARKYDTLTYSANDMKIYALDDHEQNGPEVEIEIGVKSDIGRSINKITKKRNDK